MNTNTQSPAHPTPSTNPDPRPGLYLALDQVGDLIAAVHPNQANLPTPCSEFDVNALIGHLQGVVRRIGAVLAGHPFWTVPTEFDSVDWQGDWRAGRAGTDPVLADDAIITREVNVPWGTVTGAAAIGAYIGELTVHSWDLAVATGLTDQLDDDLATGALRAYQQFLPAEPRGGQIPFGPVVETDPDATAYERLVAWTGRDPHAI